VTGEALDFCLVVTQRRRVDDTNLVVEGPLPPTGSRSRRRSRAARRRREPGQLRGVHELERLGVGDAGAPAVLGEPVAHP
jgi:hypothetical protein